MHLVVALASQPAQFHHPITLCRQQHLAWALSGADSTIFRSAQYYRAACLFLRAALARMDWERAGEFEPLLAYDVIRESPAWQSDFDILR